jgi:hypothetical protein
MTQPVTPTPATATPPAPPAIPPAEPIPTDPVLLANALRLEQAKNKVLLDEVIALEDVIVNRDMADFDAVVTDESRDFWREQLLTNRAAATVALKELAQAKAVQPPGPDSVRRPLHNRAISRPTPPATAANPAAPATPADSDDRAASIRNRAAELVKAERIPFSAAFRRAEKEFSGK